MPERPLLGILGGMGPAATAAFYTQLVTRTPATRDQDHLRVVMWADPTVPDRTAALTGAGPSVVPWLERGVRALRASGADVIVSPCNTAHVWLGPVAREQGVELLSIVDATIERALAVGGSDGAVGTSPVEAGPNGVGPNGVGPIGVLATSATLGSGLYQQALGERSRVALLPEPPAQERLIEAIYRVKVGTPAALEQAAAALADVCRQLVAAGATTIISACTELSLVLPGARAVPIIDSTDALVRAVLHRFHQPGTSSPGTPGPPS
ncbi:aspartate/glutamate racemase family protein [Pseudactinotalea sp. Z1748]|uniref:aspartate/glutamate racemase family protein n=1 Tax=Pseudactinotalea sp. Z1748 TaxID=3413027 RepID=UPI003C7A72BC